MHICEQTCENGGYWVDIFRDIDNIRMANKDWRVSILYHVDYHKYFCSLRWNSIVICFNSQLKHASYINCHLL